MDASRIIRVARERAGLSKRELARRAGTSPAAIVKYESGQVSPTVDTLNRIVACAGWLVEPSLAALEPDAKARGAMMADLLSVVDAVHIRQAGPDVRFPRFGDVVR